MKMRNFSIWLKALHHKRKLVLYSEFIQIKNAMNATGAIPTETASSKLIKIKNEIVPFETLQTVTLWLIKKRERAHQPERRDWNFETWHSN